MRDREFRSRLEQLVAEVIELKDDWIGLPAINAWMPIQERHEILGAALELRALRAAAFAMYLARFFE